MNSAELSHAYLHNKELCIFRFDIAKTRSKERVSSKNSTFFANFFNFFVSFPSLIEHFLSHRWSIICVNSYLINSYVSMSQSTIVWARAQRAQLLLCMSKSTIAFPCCYRLNLLLRSRLRNITISSFVQIGIIAICVSSLNAFFPCAPPLFSSSCYRQFVNLPELWDLRNLRLFPERFHIENRSQLRPRSSSIYGLHSAAPLSFCTEISNFRPCNSDQFSCSLVLNFCVHPFPKRSNRPFIGSYSLRAIMTKVLAFLKNSTSFFRVLAALVEPQFLFLVHFLFLRVHTPPVLAFCGSGNGIVEIFYDVFIENDDRLVCTTFQNIKAEFLQRQYIDPGVSLLECKFLSVLY